jgi:hypothetical protein
MNDDLRGQYENYPYPPRDPADEAKRLIAGSPSHICEIEHHILGGVRTTAGPFRILVAGGGTGDATVMLAAQHAAAGIDAEIVHLDISKASSAIAEARIKARRSSRCSRTAPSNPLPGRTSVRSTTSTAAACCTIWKTPWPG